MKTSIALCALLVVAVEMFVGPVFAQDLPESVSGLEVSSPPSAESQPSNAPPETDSLPSKMDIQMADDKDLLTLNYLNVDIREALSALAIEREISIATSQDVSGNISVHLYQVSLGEALDAISMAGGCKYRKDGNLYYVYKPEDDIDPQAEEYEVRVFELQYTEIDQIQEILDSFTDVHLLKIHEPTKTIIIEDTPKNIEKIEAVIDHWDKKPKQALIEVKILEIVLTDAMSFGVDWEQILGDVRIGTGGFSTAVPPADPDVSPVPSTGVGMFANALTAAGTGHQFAAALDTLQTMTEINVLSTPKLLAVHDKAARVQVGGEQGYRVTTSNLGVTSETIEFIDTGIILDLTPYFDEEGNALLEVQPSISTVRLEEGIPVVNTTVVTTWVFAKNGETIFIGGLIQERKTKTKEGIPYLRRIPLLGNLFGRTGRSTGKSEFVVLMTPHVIHPEIERVSQMKSKQFTEAQREFEE